MRLFIVLSMALLLVGCGRSMVKYDYQPIDVNQDRQEQMLGVESSIIRACRDQGWTPQKLEPGKINASITVRGRHQITVLVTYDDAGFGISPVSTNMKNIFGRVHKKYNAWVSNLHRRISKQIARDRA